MNPLRRFLGIVFPLYAFSPMTLAGGLLYCLLHLSGLDWDKEQSHALSQEGRKERKGGVRGSGIIIIT